MAIYSNQFKNVSRSGRNGRTSIASLAYIEGGAEYDELLQRTFKYASKDEVMHVETILPEHAPEEYRNANRLWNSLEWNEKASNARIAKLNIVALPRECCLEQQIMIMQDYIQKAFITHGYCATYAIHDKGDGNPHAHIMVSNRQIDKDGKWTTKEKKEYALDDDGERIPVIDKRTGLQKLGKRNEKLWKRISVKSNLLNSKDYLRQCRKIWAQTCNKYLAEDACITELSYQDQYRIKAIEAGFTEEKDIQRYIRENAPTPTIHEGYTERKMESRGGTSPICEHNRQIRNANLLRAIEQCLKIIYEEIHFLLLDKRKMLMDKLGIVSTKTNDNEKEQPKHMSVIYKVHLYDTRRIIE